jgi:hypothetical protein
MPTIPLSERQREGLHELVLLSASRAQAETDTEAASKARTEAADQEFQEAQRKIQNQFDAALAAAEHQAQDARLRIKAQHDQDLAQATAEFNRAQARARHMHHTTKEKLEADFKESRWTISTIYDADKKVAKEQRATTESRTEAALTRISNLNLEAKKLLGEWNLTDLEAVPAHLPIEGEEDPNQALQRCSVWANTKVQEMKGLTLPVFRGKFPWLCVLGWVLVTAPAFLIDDWYIWVLASTGIACLVFFLGRSWLERKCHSQVKALLTEIAQAQADGQKLHPRCLALAKTLYREQRAESKKRNQESLQQAIRTCREQLRASHDRRDHELEESKIVVTTRRKEISRRRKDELEQAEVVYQRQLAECHAVHDNELQQAKEKHTRLRDDNNRRHAQDWTRLASAWKQGLDKFLGVVQDVHRECRRLFPPWNDPAWKDWKPSAEIPQGIDFGQLALSMDNIPHGIPHSLHLPRLQLGELTFPAFLPFPQKASVLFKTYDEGRSQAVASIQALMLRFLTGLPPGKVRFTIMDPVGRGENFASFMHLADYDEQLVSSRIWTEATHIEQRLADLTAHMENVLQKYLRNRYETLEEYNREAGEVAEPFRILVVANFPTNFSPEASRRLISLATSGARCGIYTLILADMRQELPQGFVLADLEAACLNLDWHQGGFAWNDPDFSVFPLELERFPDADFITPLMHVVGQAAKLAGKVEVPFDYVAPPMEKYWTCDSRTGIAVALGRAGATGRQLLQLGQGTAQHALISGKTGSGKSTLLHALITQIALSYSPDEVELYLIDFKKGVEFKTYAANELPHARVVAVESEREFGLSVLQRLDVELKNRGERFRKSGVNDLNSFRENHAGDNGQQNMPRILLIIDEFQEFFVEDDKIAQESALLLDRLVRQGRAFGIHVLLGSQTLGGAYSLARSTIDQMAIRIALQCSEADAHLILSKDNAAARLLSRPGEAIYNAAGGLLEGNNLFQVVWLSDERRDQALRSVAGLARERHFTPPGPQIVFEGTAPSDLYKNPELEKRLEAYPPASTAPILHGWLGEAIAIKDPTAAVFRRQSGANLLMVGQQGEAAFCMMASTLMGLACQIAPTSVVRGPSSVAKSGADNGPRTTDDGPRTTSLPLASINLVSASPLEPAEEQLLARLPDILGPILQVVQVRDVPALIASLSEELERRMKTPGHEEPLFLFLHGLQRLRDLRRAEDDFGFSRREDKPSPSKMFQTILREGPMVGIFTVVWCDNLNNLNRTLDRAALREFEMRVLGQMSQADSSNLIDSPLAGKLGQCRALFSTEDQGRLEKFRPYGPPPAEWLDRVMAIFHKGKTPSLADAAR